MDTSVKRTPRVGPYLFTPFIWLTVWEGDHSKMALSASPKDVRLKESWLLTVLRLFWTKEYCSEDGAAIIRADSVHTQFQSTTICLLRTFRLTAAFTHVKSRVGCYFLLGQVIGDFLKWSSLFFLLNKFLWVMQNVQATWTEHHSTNTTTKDWEVSGISYALSYNQSHLKPKPAWLSSLMNQWDLKTNDKSTGKRVWTSPVTTDTDHLHDVWIYIELCWYIASKALSCPHVCGFFLVLIVEYTTTLNCCSPLSYLQLLLSFNLDGFFCKQYVFFNVWPTTRWRKNTLPI